MLSTGIFPDAIKLSKVIPLFKKCDTKDLYINFTLKICLKAIRKSYI